MFISRLLLFISLLFAVLVVNVLQVLVGDLPQTVSAVSFGFCAALLLYLGADASAILARSFQLPKGQTAKLDTFRYVLVMILLVVFVASLGISFKVAGNPNDTALQFPIYAFFGTVITVIGSRKVNKIAQEKGEENAENHPQNPSGGDRSGDRPASCRGGGPVAGSGEPGLAQRNGIHVAGAEASL
ncbi:MAG: hypothetical protein AAF975_06285 [Spirochaetota bacterium]